MNRRSFFRLAAAEAFVAAIASAIVRKVRVVVNVIDYGADPTGQRDSSAAFYAALHDVRVGSDKVVFIPEGTYYIPARYK